MPFVRSQLTSSRYAYLGGLPQLHLSPDDFDTATAKVLLKGTRDTVATLFPAGSKTSGLNENLYCTGPKIEKEMWGHVWAAVEWKGLVGEHDMIFNHSVTTRETMWPQNNDGVTIFVPKAMLGKTSDTNSATGKYWRVRLTDQLSGVAVRGVSKGLSHQPPNPPSTGAGTFAGPIIGGKVITPIARQQNFSGLVDPILNAPRGWVLVNYDIQQAIALGDGEALYFWTANYEYKWDYGP